MQCGGKERKEEGKRSSGGGQGRIFGDASWRAQTPRPVRKLGHRT